MWAQDWHTELLDTTDKHSSSNCREKKKKEVGGEMGCQENALLKMSCVILAVTFS